jgi:hypothetical protein
MKKLSLALFSLVLLFSSIFSPAQSRIAIPSYQDPGSAQWGCGSRPIDFKLFYEAATT